MAPTSSFTYSLIEAALSSPDPVLLFGSFTLKSGRQSPYFFNSGLFNTGNLLLALSVAFADAILLAYPAIGLPSPSPSPSSTTPEILFGPAYKGIPLAAAIATELAYRGRDVGYAYDRKEKKDHGEGGAIVGADLRGRRVLVVDDAITKGTAIREAHGIVSAAGGITVGIVTGLDRQERGKGERSTVQEVEEDLGLPVLSVITMSDIIAWLKDHGRTEQVEALEEYRKQYGI